MTRLVAGTHRGRRLRVPAGSGTRPTSDRAREGLFSSLRLLRLLADEDLIGLAREEATALVSADPQLARHPALRAGIDELLGVQAEYLDKT